MRRYIAWPSGVGGEVNAARSGWYGDTYNKLVRSNDTPDCVSIKIKYNANRLQTNIPLMPAKKTYQNQTNHNIKQMKLRTPCASTILNINSANKPAVPNHLLRTCGVHLSRVCLYWRLSDEYWFRMESRGPDEGSSESIIVWFSWSWY